MLKLAPSIEQSEALLATMQACNAAATCAAGVAFQHKTANKIRLQTLCYARLREQFGLSAQMAIRAVAKACEACTRPNTSQPKFRPLGAVAYDQRILSWKGPDQVSILVAVVDPRNTSRECPECGDTDKANRPSRDRFACRRCGLAGPSDHIAARVIASRAVVMQPHAARRVAASHAA